jgi:hypothetical protein
VWDTRCDGAGEDGSQVVSRADSAPDIADGMDEGLILQEYYLNVDIGLVGS